MDSTSFLPLGRSTVRLSFGEAQRCKLAKRNVVEDLNLLENITTIEQEMVIETMRCGYVLIEVPTHEYQRNLGRSFINVWKVGFRYVYSLIKNAFYRQ
jgi:dolichol-phosphate mannosyltransferase